MSILLTADLHLTDNVRDEYRWGVFKFIKEQAQKYRTSSDKITHLFILGDLTDSKDRHKSQFVNRIVDELTLLMEHFPNTYILAGNHDSLYPNTPFFKFCNLINTVGPEIEYVTEPREVRIQLVGIPRYEYKSEKIILFPYSKTAAWDWREYDCSGSRMIFTHATFDGAVVENGQEMEGLPITVFKNRPDDCQIFSGDIHVPQKIGPLEYIGAPYPIRFGDEYNSRLLLISSRVHMERLDILEKTNLYFETIKKHLINISHLDELYSNKDLMSGDQIKVRIKLSREDRNEWDKIKRGVHKACKDKGLILGGIELDLGDEQKQRMSRGQFLGVETSEQILDRFVKEKGIDSYTASIGKSILEES